MTSWPTLAVTSLVLIAGSQQIGNAKLAAIRGYTDANISAPENAPAPSTRSSDPSHATVVGSLKSELVGKGKLDGALITDVRPASRCTTIFVTRAKSVSVDWSKVGNFAGSIEGKVTSIPIDDGHGVHSFAMPNGPGFRRVDGAMGLLADDCGGPM